MPIRFYDSVLVCAYQFPVWKRMFRGSGLCVRTVLTVAKGVSLYCHLLEIGLYTQASYNLTKDNDQGKTKTRTKQEMKAMTN